MSKKIKINPQKKIRTRSQRNKFLDELQVLINQHSIENGSDTPDFILAEHLMKCLESFEQTTKIRNRYYGK